MKYDKDKYVGKKIWLWPIDSDKKEGIIEDVDDLGWTIKITNTQDHRRFPVGSVHFISHSKPFWFTFI